MSIIGHACMKLSVSAQADNGGWMNVGDSMGNQDSLLSRLYKPIREALPKGLANFVRSCGSAILGPLLWATRTGFIRSCFAMAAVTRRGAALPWYTYPAIDFLRGRSFEGRRVLEFGGGQSSLWWAARAAHVLTLEGDAAWFERIKGGMPKNVDLVLVDMLDTAANVADVERVLAKSQLLFDVVIIDGLFRREMVDFALKYLASDGVLICDNADGYGFYERLRDSGLGRVDFYGNSPGLALPNVTSMFFRPSGSFVLSAAHPIAWDRWGAN